MDISKYITNKEIQLSNDDINIEKLEKDIRKGYMLESEHNSALEEAINTNNKEYTNKYTDLENKYTELEKNYNALEERNTNINNSNERLKLEVEMVSQGFTKDKFEEIAKLRNTLYADEKDNFKAIGMIKEKFGATYFPEQKPLVDVPNEGSLGNTSTENHEINITRKTSIKDLWNK